MVTNMPDSRVLNRIIERANWLDSVPWTGLKTVTDENGDQIKIMEGETGKWADRRALNFVSLALWEPKQAFRLLREEAPNNAEDILEDFEPGIVKATGVLVVDDHYDVARSKGFVENVSRLAADLAGDTREENYVYRTFRGLAESETKLNAGTNPLGRTSQFYMRGGPVRVDADDPDGDSAAEPEPNSAAEAEW